MISIVSFMVFVLLGVISIILSMLAVLSRNLFRSITYLFLVLLCTAGFYLFLNYHFLAAIQISVYVGGVVILFIFAVFLTDSNVKAFKRNRSIKCIIATVITLSGVLVTSFALLNHQFIYTNNCMIEGDMEIDMKLIGKYLIGVEKYQYFLPFEVLSLLLFVCIIGGILIAKSE
ncbi:MAG: NADH-quinone oxidoreductase subunit J [Bacteroidales bacterium OttesenSCG-928-I14]|jgi:NADH-quinone oxidoreductase subunit J|nr:NADH-quinone oxidoreductase subunit J [Bacteroidales bacterium OttesenSCG-928-I14]